MAQNQNEKEALVCVYEDCKNLQSEDGEYCEYHNKVMEKINPFAEAWKRKNEATYNTMALDKDLQARIANGEVIELPERLKSQSSSYKKFMGGIVIGFILGVIITLGILANLIA